MGDVLMAETLETVETVETAEADFVALLDAAEHLLGQIARRTMAPGFVDQLPRVSAAGPAHDGEWGLYAAGAEERLVPAEEVADGSLPHVHLRVERLSRTLTAAQTALVGHAVAAYDQESTRAQTLGIPAGKSAFRSGRDYLRSHLQVPLRDVTAHAKRAENILPRRSFDHAEVLPPPWPVLAEAVADFSVSATAADHVADALTKAQLWGQRSEVSSDRVNELLRLGEAMLTESAATLDPDAVRRVAARWLVHVEADINPDGDEPTEAELRARQGMIYQGRRGRLHRWVIHAADDQHETLMTVASAATHAFTTGQEKDAVGTEDRRPVLPLFSDRSRDQRQLDGLISALAGALSLAEDTGLPSVAGARPHILVTVDLQTLLRMARTGGEAQQDLLLQSLGPPEARGAGTEPEREDPGTQRISEAAFTGPINPSTIRRWMCDGAVIPVVLGGKGQILDYGVERRSFPLAMRRAITARDGGCAAPGCSIPAPWCEVHHIQHWEHGGPTSTDNGVLLCSHHHHAVHAGAWQVQTRGGRPWFVPAAYLDPDRVPRRNLYWRS